MKKKKNPLMVDLLRGRISFGEESTTIKIVVILIVAIFLIIVLVLLKHLALPILGSFSWLLGLFRKGRSP